MLPLQTPGGPELLVVALIAIVLVAIVVAVAFLLRRLTAEPSPDAERIDALERRVAELEATCADRRDEP